MKLKPKVRRLVQNLLLFDNDIEKIFHRACKKLNYSPIPVDQFKDCLKCFQEYRERPENYQPPFEHFHRDLFYIILQEHQNKNTGVASWDNYTTFKYIGRFDPNYSIQLLSGRYAVEFKRGQRGLESLILHDVFYGKERELKFIGDAIINFMYSILLIDPEHLLITDIPSEQNASCSIFLLELNIEEQTCTLKNKVAIAFSGIRIVMDAADRRNFVVIMASNKKMYFERYRIDGSRLVWNRVTKEIHLSQVRTPGSNYEFSYAYRLLGNTLQMIMQNDTDIDDMSFRFIECNLDQPGRILESSLLCSIKQPENMSHLDHFQPQFWQSDICYMFFVPGTSKFDGIRLVMFDRIKLTANYLLPHFVGKCGALHVEDDEHLSLLVSDKHSKKLVLHRVPLNNKPESLEILSMREFGRQAKKHDTYEQLFSQFPVKLRPFNLDF